MNHFIEFRPHPWIKGGIFQTLYAHFLNKARVDEAREIVVDLNDGDKIFCLIDHPELPHDAPILMLYHGLGGCSNSSYLQSIAKLAKDEGIRTVRFNHRGANARFRPFAKQIYHSGRHEDLLTATEAISKEYKNAPIFLCGFSLSGNILLNMLAIHREKIIGMSNVKAAFAVCPPVNLDKCSQLISKPKNKLFDLYFGRQLLRQLKVLEKIHKVNILKKVKRFVSIRVFDEIYTAPLSGYKSRSEYYQTNSSVSRLNEIQTPSVILASRDDPIIDTNDLENLENKQYISTEIYDHGGHLGFIHSLPLPTGTRRWMDYRIIEWVKGYIASITKV